MKQIEVLSVNISEEKGVIKNAVDKIILCDTGIKNDAHSGKWHRQISMLAQESISRQSMAAGRDIKYGEFAENITTKGIELKHCNTFDKFVSDKIELMVTQIGKKCHGENCAIFKEVGNCVMPKEGIFLKVIKGGELKAGDLLVYKPKTLKIKALTLSDRASIGEYADKSGPFIVSYCKKYFEEKNYNTEFNTSIIADDKLLLETEINKAIEDNYDIIFTTGGTGIGERDITPDVVKNMLSKEIPGIMELIRVKYGMQNPNAIISRSVAGTINNTLIYTMPGSPKAVKEYLDEIMPTIAHSMRMIHGIDKH